MEQCGFCGTDAALIPPSSIAPEPLHLRNTRVFGTSHVSRFLRWRGRGCVERNTMENGGRA